MRRSMNNVTNSVPPESMMNISAGSDGFQAAKISVVGAWFWYVVIFVVWALAIAYLAGFRISLKESFSRKWYK